MYTIMSLFRGFIENHSYESELEKYIVRNDPQSVGDVELLTKEFEQKNNQPYVGYTMQ